MPHMPQRDPLMEGERAIEERQRQAKTEFNALAQPNDVETEDLSDLEKFMAGCNELGGDVKDKGGATQFGSDRKNTKSMLEGAANDVERHGIQVLVCDMDNTMVAGKMDEEMYNFQLVRANGSEIKDPDVDATPHTKTRGGEMQLMKHEGRGVITVDEEGVEEVLEPDNFATGETEEERTTDRFEMKRARADIDEAIEQNGGMRDGF